MNAQSIENGLVDVFLKRKRYIYVFFLPILLGEGWFCHFDEILFNLR